ncbi:MAG: cobalamin-binding protein [Bryobacteraceae bacterium]|nr:cobalamin-binding protein [Bryobacteraceae bacterium]MDW8380162.1 cobalamin-binding protein [Bryobacterales bacterium]
MGPRRIVCLTEETTETLYLLGEQHRIVGISGYTCRPPEARREKPKVSAFTSAKIDRILALDPDFIIGFSNLQAGIAQELIRAGRTVLITNQRSVEEIFETILLVGRIVDAGLRAQQLVDRFRQNLEEIQKAARAFERRPRVYFEEWMDPLISGIRWVEELIEIAGGDPIFPELRQEHDAARRIVDPLEVVARDPQVILASWCGRKVNLERIRSRPGWDRVSAVRDQQIHEIKSTLILQPGPAAVTDGVTEIHRILARWAASDGKG